MAMSDCPRCWEIPCSCGYDYLDAKPEWVARQIKMLSLVQCVQAEMPNASKDERGTRLRELRAELDGRG